jgi:aminodeoxyfutalosine deaminase
MDGIGAWTEQGMDVFIGLGYYHFMRQQDFLEQRYGKPVIYRAGQMSGDLLMGNKGLTPADIRRGIVAVQQRIDGTEDALTRQLWQEELEALRHELAERS